MTSLVGGIKKGSDLYAALNNNQNPTDRKLKVS